ncbi:DUF3429 domain-containing protein [Shewanella submarina]|uniref:DUF3429 domain-containing protein n=1 Tax=Shewanella submarina TaxID=2016376 RepID=A0ABV7GAY0_9GAMM|nr:DUF3429 domain-containing protein [Shewanella submarina]MCL1037111.1 DUF3429 domain-containing protein [Shewanella submarina]
MTDSTATHHNGSHSESLLGYAGLLPFVLAIIYSLTGSAEAEKVSTQVFVSYSAIILSFLCGALWHKVRAANWSRPLLLVTNILTLLGWACLALSPTLALLALTLCYEVVLVIEQWADRDETREYLTLRRRLTAIVIGLHLLYLILT